MNWTEGLWNVNRKQYEAENIKIQMGQTHNANRLNELANIKECTGKPKRV